ncbi:unnamed protein product [Acanthoscelides obtectus]|uniref:DUF7869 domain-containing protein n=1 Tax=Acanthoscelides obtectus TaxID=200917 RepID=A0A9P0P5L9_ACAOB|nr:unnamed protein product [Acanthoscelides obtectus]CAK1633543.1 hypothetical protein AOBTE_LOCUS8212 [Acanthoscelides obtectus]
MFFLLNLVHREKVAKNFFNQKHIKGMLINLLGELPRERRGGNRVGPKNDETRNCIKRFIESITCTESHYCRSKTSVRVYLPCDLNFKKLFDHYLRRVPQPMHVKLSYFRKFVNANYNIAFGTPLTDCCSTCLRTKEQLKVATLDVRQNHQINYNNFTVVAGTSTDKLRPKNMFSYLWTEIDARKDSNTIASALQHALKNFDFDPSKETVRLFADGCGGQNKNTNMMAMLAYWLLEESPKHITQIELIFPIVGHSFIPPDRIFGLIEKDIKKMPVIVEISDYDDLIRKHSTIRKIGIDWDVFDWRTQAKRVIKLPSSWHFEFNKAKWFIFYRKDKNVLVEGEPNYCSDVGQAKSICKKKCSIPSMAPEKLPLGKGIKGDKSTINVLLSNHYGANWRSLPELNFYKEYLKTASASPEETVDSLENCQNAENDCFFI